MTMRRACMTTTSMMLMPITIVDLADGRADDGEERGAGREADADGDDHRAQQIPACVAPVPGDREDVGGEQDRQCRAGNRPAGDDGGDQRAGHQGCTGKRRLRQADDQAGERPEDQVARGEHRRSLRGRVIATLVSSSPAEIVGLCRCAPVACAATLPAFFDNPQIPERRR